MPRTFRVPQSTKRRDSINQPLTLSSFIFFSFLSSSFFFLSFSLISLLSFHTLYFHRIQLRSSILSIFIFTNKTIRQILFLSFSSPFCKVLRSFSCVCIFHGKIIILLFCFVRSRICIYICIIFYVDAWNLETVDGDFCFLTFLWFIFLFFLFIYYFYTFYYINIYILLILCVFNSNPFIKYNW